MKMTFLALQSEGVGRLLESDLNVADLSFSCLNTDTRSLKKGDVFLALVGENFNGHDYIAEALAKGASGIIVEQAYVDRLIASGLAIPVLVVKNSVKALGEIGRLHRRGFTGTVTAITGSCGKTTVKGLLKSICEHAGDCLATHGNLNNHIGVPFTLMRLPYSESSAETTDEKSYAVIEAGASAVGEIRYLTSLIEPQVSLVNNVMPAHIEGFGSIEAIAQEKAEIYGDANSDCVPVINLDSQWVPFFFEKIQDRPWSGFSSLEQNTVMLSLDESYRKTLRNFAFARNIAKGRNGCMRFDLVLVTGPESESTAPVALDVPGQHNISNALAAALCAWEMGVGIDDIAKGLESFSGEKGRMQILPGWQGARLVDDSYNANPGSMKAAIDFLAQQENSILVCGDMAELGEGSLAEHSAIGDYAKSKGVQRVLAVGQYAPQIVDAFGEEGQVFSDQSSLINELKQSLSETSTVLVKGSRSAKMEVVTDALTLHEDDQNGGRVSEEFSGEALIKEELK